jgi:DNA-binding response OmpR family regulator
VEDSDDLLHLFARVLQRNGLEVRETTDGREALDCLPGFEPEVVVTDLMRPGVDGFELIRRIKATPSLVGVPVVVLIAAATTESEREARRAGAADLFAKPVHSRTLVDRIGGVRRPGRYASTGHRSCRLVGSAGGPGSVRRPRPRQEPDRLDSDTSRARA